MGCYHLVSVLLLLFVASSMSQENTTDNDIDTTDEENIPLTEKVILPSTGYPSVQKQEAETPALPKVTSVPVATEVITSQEPMTMSSAVTLMTFIAKDSKVTNELSTPNSEFGGPSATSKTVATDFKVTNGLSTPNSEINDPSTTSKTVDIAIIPVKDEAGGSESPTDDQITTSPSTTQNEIDSRDEEENVNHTDREREKDFSTTKPPGQVTNTGVTKQDGPKGGWSKVILIGALIFSLIFLLVIMIFFLCRKKKRSGSFRTQSKKNAKRDVWAGQVPELGDGRAAQDLTMAENGRAGTELEAVKEEELTTFVAGEKKSDSVIEINELGGGEKATANGGGNLSKGDSMGEKTPLLEEASEESPKPDEQFPDPPME